MVVNNVKLVPNRFTTLVSAATATAAVIGLSIAAVNSQGSTVKIDGSSTVYPITEKIAEGFQKSTGTKVTVGISGTGGGFKKFCAGDTDISNASRPILKKEMDACRAKGISYIELPVAYDALTVVVNPANNWATNLTPAELKKIWEPGSTVKNWREVRSGFPNQPMTLFGPGADSGTFDYFTEAINGKSKASRKDFTASEDDNVLVQGVSRDKGALGYFGLAYYEANKSRLKAVKVNNVAPTPQNVINGSYTPLSRPIFIYVNSKSAKKPEVKRFVDYYMKNASNAVKSVKYVPLPANAYGEIAKRFNAGKTGTIFGGEEAVGLKIDDLITRELKN
ncbi:MAG: PstS family phosphate ABC transporter substrate-binding protein [Oscillatoriales cyanobacterium C42_A2020_001]|nr:PstS family phosphate ABC transporter substrate-binding protein [Leptolyngbyaceae cyanobacterium C42_A2020_001]